MKKNQIKAATMAFLIAVTCSGCQKKEQNFTEKELMSIIEENDLNLSQIYNTYRSEILEKCSIVPEEQYNKEELLNDFSYLNNNYDFDYSLRFLNYYSKYLNNTNNENIDTRSYVTTNITDLGYDENIRFENNGEKYLLMNTSSTTYEQEINNFNTSFTNSNYTYNISILSKYNKKKGTKNQYLNNLENSCICTYMFYNDNLLSISIINNNDMEIDNNYIKINNNQYEIIIYYDNEIVYESNISETKFNEYLNDFNEMNNDNITYEEFITMDSKLSNKVLSKIKPYTRTRNK